MKPSSCIHIEGISKQYRGNDNFSLNNVSLSIKSQEIFGILGPNGAGKTTLISILCGILKPTSGSFTYQIGNQSLSEKNIKNHIGYVPQDFAFYEELTPIQNLAFFGSMYNLSKSQIEKQSSSLLDILGLTDVRNKKISTFSGGMKRRVNLAIGVLHQPKILFLDEPTVGVDVQSKRAIFNFLKEENKNGTTIIYTSHNMKDVEEFCTQIALIDFGNIIAYGTINEVLINQNAVSLEDFFIAKTGDNYRDV